MAANSNLCIWHIAQKNTKLHIILRLAFLIVQLVSADMMALVLCKDTKKS